MNRTKNHLKTSLSISFFIAGFLAMASLNAASISGEVSGSGGPEAGVWVIAETDDLATKFIKIVVTDSDGKFLLPELPDASYSVWVRGYGLQDSTAVQARPGDNLALEADYPIDAQQAAQVYPASYWYSLVEPPSVDEFTNPGSQIGGVGAAMQSQEAFVDSMKQNCELCHQLGNKLTREVGHIRYQFESTVEAWSNRVNFGQYGGWMNRTLSTMGRERTIAMYADWTDRIAGGEVPASPPRPQGAERNIVLTLWDWGNDTSFVHDEIVTDKRNPRVNANGPFYGVSESDGVLVVVDPNTHVAREFEVPMRTRGEAIHDFVSSPFFGDEEIFRSQAAADTHNPMMDGKGRVWMTSRVRIEANTDACKAGSTNSSANYFPLNSSSRHASYFDPDTEEMTLIDTCYSTHHLQFASDADDTLWFSGDTQAIGWINTRLWDETGNELAAQGWCPTVIDTNGDGEITKPWNEPGQSPVAGRDTRLVGFAYGIIPNPRDGSVWITRTQPTPGQILRLDPGSNPPFTCKTEVYEPPFDLEDLDRDQWGFAPRGIDIDSEGVLWTALSGSGHMASFDRSKCEVLSGPTATGQHCQEGWTLYRAPGPRMKGAESGAGADHHYYNWVDQFDTLGLGKDTPIANGTGSDSLLALNPETAEWVVMRVPYPLGFYSRGLDGRIDDPDGGWKGSAVYADFGSIANWHMEGGKGSKSKIVKFQMRPSPLAE
ncbi:MAG: carboxypeptidase regulatory-like domain-containing protein [Gammaproteobacteria bacterium]|nr:carboxypeptidase regulatory-like domain-containing protein [Gammaproteobacteria bacterium]